MQHDASAHTTHARGPPPTAHGEDAALRLPTRPCPHLNKDGIFFFLSFFLTTPQGSPPSAPECFFWFMGCCVF